MMGSRCGICGKTHVTPLELHLCSIKLGNKKSVGWCLWCGANLRRGLFCAEQCRISYLNDVHEEEIVKQCKKVLSGKNRLRVPARVFP